MSNMSLHPDARHVLVTGGAGFIGTHLLGTLLEAGDRVTVVDNLSTGRRDNLAAFPETRVRFIQASVTDGLPALRHERFDAIYHLAAAVGVRLVIEQPVRTIRTNVLETTAVLDFAAAQDVPTFIASTSEVYGKSNRLPFREDDDVIYGPTIYSRWSYACSKAIDEYLALAYHRERNLPVRIVRFFNTVGPGQVGNYGMVLPRFVQAALRDEPLLVHGDGEQSRCFCDVRDVVEVLPRLMAETGTAGRIFNLGNDQPISIRALAERVKATLDSRSEIRLIPYDTAFGEHFDDLRHRQPDLSRIRDAVGFQPRIPLTQTIRDLAARLSTGGDPPVATTGADRARPGA